MAKLTRASKALGSALATVSLLQAQRGGGDWMTAGYDAQRSNWVRGDGKISPETMAKPGFQFLWKVKLKNTSRQMSSITAPALIDFYIGYRGFRTLGFFGGSSNSVTGIDTDLAVLEWEKTLAANPSGSGTLPCPGGMSSTVTRPTNTGYPPAVFGRGGRGTPARSGVGDPLEGAVTLRNVPLPPVAAAPAPTGGRRVAAPANPFASRPQYVLALDSEGRLHAMYLSNGDEPNPPIPFIPANANAQGLISFDDRAYAATFGNCGGVPDGLWSVGLKDGKASSWKAPGPIAGSMGPAASPEDTFYITAGKQLVSVDAKDLKQKAVYESTSAFATSPLVFEQRGKDVVAAATTDGRIHVVEPSLSKAIAAGPVSAPPAAGAMASWQDAAGTRWILVPAGGPVTGFKNTNGQVTNGAITAWKIVETGGSSTLEPGWVSRDLVSPATPIIVNGVVFALSSGKSKRAPAVLYALDSLSGRVIWSSGSTIHSFVTTGGLAAGGGRVYLGTHDGTQYSFGFPMEH
jgi:hypothetical protein